MKPDWKDAPEWANFMARDSDGEWRVFEVEPTVDEHRAIWVPNQGRHQVLAHWTESKERRP
jgi:hypothetical protein